MWTICRKFSRITSLKYLLLVMLIALLTAVVLWINHTGIAVLEPRPNYAMKHSQQQSRSPEHQGYVSPNHLLKMTALGIKTYNRPDCLKELRSSLKTYAPYLPLFVIDDSNPDVTANNTGIDKGYVYVQLPTDSGAGYGRNKILETIHKAGFKYLIMADDYFKLTSDETIPKMAKYMLETGADVVAATRCDNKMENCHSSKGLLIVDKKNHSMTILPNITSYPPYPNAPTCFRSHLVQQFFMAKTEKLLKVKWDDKLKNNDHYDFLLTSKLHGLKLVTCSDVHILHEKKCEALSPHGSTYKKTREERWFQLLPYVMKKWNLSEIHDEFGKTISLDSKENGVSKIPVDVKYRWQANETKFYAHIVAAALNSDLSGWDWIRPLFDRETFVIMRTINNCTQHVFGALHCEYDRCQGCKNVQKTLRYSMYLYNETCPFAESLWELREFGKLDLQKHVYYVTAVADDTTDLKRLFNTLDNDKDKEHISLVVVIMDSHSLKIIESYKKKVTYKVVVINQGPPFSRSIGMKVGFQAAYDQALKKHHNDAVVFSIDTSIVVPSDFSRRVRSNTICGISAFLPVVFKCSSCLGGDFSNRTDGVWATTGYGMLGLCFADYLATGGWSAEWGYRWGAEDVDMMFRIKKHVPYVIRTKEPDYIYVKSQASKKINAWYYSKLNSYPKPLPTSSLSTFSDDPSMKQRILAYIKSKVPTLTSKNLVVKILTKTYRDGASGLTYQVIVGEMGDPENAYWFFLHSHLSPVL